MAFYGIYAQNKESANAVMETVKKGKSTESFAMADFICIKHGFSWVYAFFYINSLYALTKKRYAVAALLLAVSLIVDQATMSIINSAATEISSFMASFYRLLAMFLIGTLGGSATESYIISKGGYWMGSYFGKSEEEALRRFYSSIIDE